MNIKQTVELIAFLDRHYPNRLKVDKDYAREVHDLYFKYADYEKTKRNIIQHTKKERFPPAFGEVAAEPNKEAPSVAEQIELAKKEMEMIPDDQ